MTGSARLGVVIHLVAAFDELADVKRVARQRVLPSKWPALSVWYIPECYPLSSTYAALKFSGTRDDPTPLHFHTIA